MSAVGSGASSGRARSGRGRGAVPAAVAALVVGVAVVVALVVRAGGGAALPATTADIARLTGPVEEAGLTCASVDGPGAEALDVVENAASAAAANALNTYEVRDVAECAGSEGRSALLAVFDDYEMAKAFAFDVTLADAVQLRYGESWVAVGTPDVVEEVEATRTWYALTAR
jgi:hypothetical protein